MWRNAHACTAAIRRVVRLFVGFFRPRALREEHVPATAGNHRIVRRPVRPADDGVLSGGCHHGKHDVVLPDVACFLRVRVVVPPHVARVHVLGAEIDERAPGEKPALRIGTVTGSS